MKRQSVRWALAGLLVLAAAVSGCASSDDTPTSAALTSAAPDVHAAPAKVVWSRFQGVPIPLGDDGPADPTLSAAHGYHHTPQGAALAAIGATIRLSVATDTQWQAIAATLVAPGPQRDSWAVNRVQVAITDTVPNAAAPQVLGYVIGDYSADKATVTIVSRQSDSSLSTNAATVLWVGGDWKLLLPDPTSAPPVTSIGTVPAAMVALPENSAK